MVQNRIASSAFESRSRKTASTKPATKSTRMSLTAREPTSCASRLVMASWSRVAISAANESATQKTKDQVRRRLTASTYRSSGFGPSACYEPPGEFAHNAPAFGSAHFGAARNLGDVPATTEA